jgi:hypothetical protein
MLRATNTALTKCDMRTKMVMAALVMKIKIAQNRDG